MVKGKEDQACRVRFMKKGSAPNSIRLSSRLSDHSIYREASSQLLVPAPSCAGVATSLQSPLRLRRSQFTYRGNTRIRPCRLYQDEVRASSFYLLCLCTPSANLGSEGHKTSLSFESESGIACLSDAGCIRPAFRFLLRAISSAAYKKP